MAVTWEDWRDIADIPSAIAQNAAFALRSMDATGQPTPMTREEVRAALIYMRESSASVGAYLDGE